MRRRRGAVGTCRARSTCARPARDTAIHHCHLLPNCNIYTHLEILLLIYLFDNNNLTNTLHSLMKPCVFRECWKRYEFDSICCEISQWCTLESTILYLLYCTFLVVTSLDNVSFIWKLIWWLYIVIFILILPLSRLNSIELSTLKRKHFYLYCGNITFLLQNLL